MENESNGASSERDATTTQAQRSPVSRRTVLRAGAAASPVLLTLASRPVSAGTTTGCMVASSFISVATFTSRNPDTTISCNTKNVEYWRAQAALATPPADLALTVAGLLGTTGSTYNLQLVKDVLLSGSAIATTGALGVLQHILAMALSAKAGMLSNPGGVNLSYLQGVWASYNTYYPNYQSPSGVIMTEAQLIAWLRVLMYPLTSSR